MATLTERKEFGAITILPAGQIQMREDTIIERDGVEISRTYHRFVLEPDADITPYEQRVKDVAGVIWTKKVKDDWAAAKAARAAKKTP